MAELRFICGPAGSHSQPLPHLSGTVCSLTSILTLLHLPQGCSAETFILSHNWLPYLFFFFSVSTLSTFPLWCLRILTSLKHPTLPGLWEELRSHFIYSSKSQGSSPTVWKLSIFCEMPFQKIVKAAQLYLPTLSVSPGSPWPQFIKWVLWPKLWFTLKGHSSGIARWKKFVEQGMRKKNRASMPSQA